MAIKQSNCSAFDLHYLCRKYSMFFSKTNQIVGFFIAQTTFFPISPNQKHKTTPTHLSFCQIPPHHPEKMDGMMLIF